MKLRKRIMAAVAATSLALTAACGADTESNKNDGGVSDEPLSVALVSPQSAGDQGPVDDMIANLDKAEEDFGLETTYLETIDPSTYESTLRNLGNAETDVVITVFASMQEPVKQVAPDYPDTKFIILFADEIEEKIGNVKTVSFDVYKGMYVAGSVSAQLSESGQLGWVGGAPSPMLNANFRAFRAGAESVNPDIEVSGVYVGSFDDPSKGRDVADTMISEGIDVIQTDAAQSGQGVFEAAEARDVLVIGDADPATAAEYPNTIIATSFLRFGDALYNEVELVTEDAFEATHTLVGMSEGIVGIEFADSFLEGDSPRVADVEAAKADAEDLQGQVADGSVEVPYDPSGL